MAVAGLKRGQTGGEGDYQCLLHCMVTNTYIPISHEPVNPDRTRVRPEFDSGSTRLLRSHARVEPISHEPVNPDRTRVRLGFDSGSTRLLRSHARVEPGFDPGKQPEFDPAQE